MSDTKPNDIIADAQRWIDDRPHVVAKLRAERERLIAEIEKLDDALALLVNMGARKRARTSVPRAPAGSLPRLILEATAHGATRVEIVAAVQRAQPASYATVSGAMSRLLRSGHICRRDVAEIDSGYIGRPFGRYFRVDPTPAAPPMSGAEFLDKMHEAAPDAFSDLDVNAMAEDVAVP
jgi:hypothetical protein